MVEILAHQVVEVESNRQGSDQRVRRQDEHRLVICKVVLNRRPLDGPMMRGYSFWTRDVQR